jgi:ketosteroid isomerase-like protein
MAQADLDRTLEQYHRAANEFAVGNPEPVKALWSQADDVILANPFGPAVRGWNRVSEALDFASSRFSDGEVMDTDTLATFVTADLATIHEVERSKARVGGGEDVEAFDLRVTSTFRLEDDGWRLVHRHADPIATSHPLGPLRGSLPG